MERRKENIRNYGSSWIKPPGIPKSLYQLREEKREMLEHQEALRREALATELAQAEAEAAEAGAEMAQGVDEMEEVRDLDDDIPDAETTGLDADEEEESDEEETNHDVDGIPRAILGARVTDDAYREALARGQQTRSGGFDDEGGTEDEEDNSQMLQEQDLVHEGGQQQQRGMGFDVDLDLDLDQEQEQDLDLDVEIPEAEDEYEHTDTSAELSSSEESGDETDLPRGGFAPSTSMVRSDGTQNSMDLSSLISNSSQRGSSPRRRSGQPPRR